MTSEGDPSALGTHPLNVPHPAKFSPQILDLIEQILVDLKFPEMGTILDPFAGVGGVHRLGDTSYNTFAVELEPEWAAQSALLGPTWCGDFFKFNAREQHHASLNGDTDAEWPGGFDAVITSPTYANRMADNHNAQERCKVCMGIGAVSVTRAAQLVGTKAEQPHGMCLKCDGAGKREYKRMTYRHQLDRELSDGSSAGMQWGNEYRFFHMKAWRRVVGDILSTVGEGVFIVNVKNHIRNFQEVDVARWHRNYITDKLGMVLIEDYAIPVKGMRFGENHEARVEHEHVMVFRAREDA